MKKDYFILFILIFYLFFQLSTLDYGFKINDIKYFKNISLNQQDIKAFTEKKIIKNKKNILLKKINIPKHAANNPIETRNE